MQPVADLGGSLALAAHLRVQRGEGRLRLCKAPLHPQHLLLHRPSALSHRTA